MSIVKPTEGKYMSRSAMIVPITSTVLEIGSHNRMKSSSDAAISPSRRHKTAMPYARPNVAATTASSRRSFQESTTGIWSYE